MSFGTLNFGRLGSPRGGGGAPAGSITDPRPGYEGQYITDPRSGYEDQYVTIPEGYTP